MALELGPRSFLPPSSSVLPAKCARILSPSSSESESLSLAALEDPRLMRKSTAPSSSSDGAGRPGNAVFLSAMAAPRSDRPVKIRSWFGGAGVVVVVEEVVAAM